jgi:lantibiotic modifying enzyme
LIEIALPALDSGRGLQWSRSAESPESGGQATWCHGAAGIGSFLLHVGAAGLHDGALDTAVAAARTVAPAHQSASPVLCHGLSGSIAFLTEVARTLGMRSLLDEATRLLAPLSSFLFEDGDGRLLISSDRPGQTDLGLMRGVSGVVVTLLQLRAALDDLQPAPAAPWQL